MIGALTWIKSGFSRALGALLTTHTDEVVACPHCGANFTVRLDLSTKQAEPINRSCLCPLSAQDWAALSREAYRDYFDALAW